MSPTERRTRRATIVTLLEELAEQRRELHRRQAWGVQRAGLRDLESDQEATRRELALLLDSAS